MDCVAIGEVCCAFALLDRAWTKLICDASLLSDADMLVPAGTMIKARIFSLADA
jgi:hypothetical protein